MKKLRYGQRGASAVEFAIVLPLLVVFLFGIVEFAILAYDKAMITNASREGARLGIVWADSSDRIDRIGIQDRIHDYFGGSSCGFLITFSSTPVCPNLSNEGIVVKADGVKDTWCQASDQELEVTVKYHYDWLIVPDALVAFFSANPSYLGGTDLTAVTKMRCE